MKIRKVLVANRGEIACRIIRTLRQMQIKSVAICSDIDAKALHANLADECVYIGSGGLSNNYLNIEAVCDAAIKSGADAIHPGFGFLSENADFVKAVQESGIIFIGPSYKAVKLMGDKLSSKKIAAEAKVSTAKGGLGEISDLESAYRIAEGIGYPVLVKAVAGGGGKGMRRVNSAEELAEAYRVAQSEALKSFNDNRIFIEQYIEDPRHVEIQIIADNYGNVVCLGERECSIQRRHQKIIEEAPSSFIDDKTRQEMYRQSQSIAKSIGYSSAGTVEFIVDHKKKIYFLEVNTRLQVEHPVTELITGLDLVQEMVQIAEGKRLSYTQDSVQFNGWAMEARIYAEDPNRDFFPCTGRILRYEVPNNKGIRIDSGIREGDYISMYYDPMIAKLCAHGKDRAEACTRMQEALARFVIQGIDNNLLFLESIFHHPKFLGGETDTGFIARHYPEGFDPSKLDQDCINLFLVATCYLECFCYPSNSVYQKGGDGYYAVRIDNDFYPVRITYLDDSCLHMEYCDQLMVIRLESNEQYPTDPMVYDFHINDELYIIKAVRKERQLILSYKGMRCLNAALYPPETQKLAIHLKKSGASQETLDKVPASITGMLVRIFVQEGTEVSKGDPLFSIEAMKMENTFYAERKAKINRIIPKQGQSVQEGEIIIEYDLT